MVNGTFIDTSIIVTALGLPIYQDEEDVAVRNPFLKSSPKDSQLDQALEAMQVKFWSFQDYILKNNYVSSI